MPNANPNNNGTLIGRLAADPRAFLNQDGSKKVKVTLYVERDYKKEGKTVSDQVSVEAFVSKEANGLGPYSYAHAGDLVAVSTHIEQQPYVAANGEKVFPPATVVADGIRFLESRTTTQTRLARRTVEGAQAEEAAAEAPATEGNKYEEDSPFAAAATS